MQYESCFPFGIAEASAFIGRNDETLWLEKNIDAGIHTLLVAPRRFGKSSLALHTLAKHKTQFVEIDLHLCRTAKSVEKKIISGVEYIISAICDQKEEILKLAKVFFKKANKVWRIGLKGFVELEIEPEKYDDVAENILTVLQFLESVLKAEGKKAVIFIDEFQEVNQVDESREIQGALRNFAQKASHVVFVFSGSNRRLLTLMFDDRSMPLYQLCDTVSLQRIPEIAYQKYLAKVAKKTWNQVLDKTVVSEIFRLSERHPRRIYNLCLYVWRLADIHKKVPVEADVEIAWQHLCQSELRGIRCYLSNRNVSQLRVLIYIALGNGETISGKEGQRRTDLSSTAISNAAQLLEEQDLIERTEAGRYQLIDPVMRYVLAEFESDLID